MKLKLGLLLLCTLPTPWDPSEKRETFPLWNMNHVDFFQTNKVDGTSFHPFLGPQTKLYLYSLIPLDFESSGLFKEEKVIKIMPSEAKP